MQLAVEQFESRVTHLEEENKKLNVENEQIVRGKILTQLILPVYRP